MAEFYEDLNNAIAKHGGDDAAYQDKLKTHFKDALGYSNYVSKRDSAMGADLDLSTIKGNITPSGVKQLVGGAIDIKNQGIDTQNKMVSEVDKAAGSLAVEQIAREKKAEAEAKRKSELTMTKSGVENGVAFYPTSQLDEQMLEFMQSSETSADGNKASLQQFEAEMNAYYNDPKNMEYDFTNGVKGEGHAVHSAEEIKKAIQDRIPQDYIGNENKYFLMSRGFSENQAISAEGAFDYEAGNMSPVGKMIFEQSNPTLAKNISSMNGLSQAIKDSSAIVQERNPETGKMETSPKYTFSDLQKKNPDIPAETLKEYATPIYKKDMLDYAEDEYKKPLIQLESAKDSMSKEEYNEVKALSRDGKTVTTEDYFLYVHSGESENYPDGGMNAIKETPTYKEIMTNVKGDYGDLFNASELEKIMFDSLSSRLNY